MLGSVVMAFAAPSCLIRTYPLPPPNLERTQSDTCGPPLCAGGGVILTIVGRASPGSLIVAENLSRQRLDGSRYTASAWTLVAGNDAGVSDASGDGGISQAGEFSVTLAPLPDTGGGVTVSQVGDHVTVVQFVRNDQGSWDQSMPLDVTVTP